MLVVGVTTICIIFALASAVLILYGLQCYVMTVLYLRHRKRLVEQETIMRRLEGQQDERAFPTVVTQLPMYNEQTVAARVIEAAAAMDYPRSRHEIQVLDDSTDESREIVDRTVARLQEQGVRISVIRRNDRAGYKAGALQNGLRYTNAELVAIFDADFVPPRDFLRKAVAFFLDRPRLGLVQGRWTHLNPGVSLLTRGQAFGIDGHFIVEQAARTWNRLFMNFNGTGGVFRRQAIEESGGWQHDTLTEDLDLSYRMQLKGWETEFAPGLVVPAEIPEDINAFKNQQFRWAKGSIQTARKVLPQLLHSKVRVFPLLQATLHLLYYVVHPVVLLVAALTPVVLSLTVHHRLPSVVVAPLIAAMTVSTLGPSVMYMTAQSHLGNRSVRKYFMIPGLMLIGIGLAVNNTWAVLEGLTGRISPFHRTPKKGSLAQQRYRPIKDGTCVAEIAMGAYCCTAFAHLFHKGGLTDMAAAIFLAVYGAGFLFIGLLSVAHYHCPELIDYRPRLFRVVRAVA